MNITSRKAILIALSAVIFSTSSILTSVNSAYCNQECPVSPGTQVDYPFGFSAGCPIRLNCTEHGDILIGDFRVDRITDDNIWVRIPPTCHRSIETLKYLYSDNYAPSLQNVLVLVNCSFPSVSVDCLVPKNELNEMLTSGNCGGTTTESVRCISDAYKGVSDLLEQVKQQGTDNCRILFSGTAVHVSIPELQVLMLKWGLNSCQCSENTNCQVVAFPNSQTGYRCHCKEGFKGNGYQYPGNSGCEKAALASYAKIIILVVALAGMLTGLLVVMYFCRKKVLYNAGRRRMKLKNVVSSGNHSEDLDLPLFDLDTISKATDNFSANKKLGEGGFGPVYKGDLEGGQEIAIKRLSKCSKQGLKEFKNEVILIAKLQHRNLVKLLGCCIEADEKMLIYEYMPNNSLDSFIFDPIHKETLDWSKRKHIINGVARGLVYLHQDSRLRIIHRDLKASNVLLDKELNPKISDFGLARSFGADETEGNTNKPVGTYGYMPPEYVMDGVYSIKSDVFSFGVLVMEILCGKRNRGFYHEDDRLNLLGHAWNLFREGRHLELIDDSLGSSFSQSEMRRLFHIALLCVQHSPNDRPSMPSVALMLHGEGKLIEPKQPGFYIKRNVRHGSTSSSSNHQVYSINEVTMTPLHAR